MANSLIYPLDKLITYQEGKDLIDLLNLNYNHYQYTFYISQGYAHGEGVSCSIYLINIVYNALASYSSKVIQSNLPEFIAKICKDIRDQELITLINKPYP